MRTAGKFPCGTSACREKFSDTLWAVEKATKTSETRSSAYRGTAERGSRRKSKRYITKSFNLISIKNERKTLSRRKVVFFKLCFDGSWSFSAVRRTAGKFPCGTSACRENFSDTLWAVEKATKTSELRSSAYRGTAERGSRRKSKRYITKSFNLISIKNERKTLSRRKVVFFKLCFDGSWSFSAVRRTAGKFPCGTFSLIDFLHVLLYTAIRKQLILRRMQPCAI